MKSGSGKSLYKRRRDEQLQEHTQSVISRCVSLPLHEKTINLNYVTGNLLIHVEKPHNMNERIIHIDITNEVSSLYIPKAKLFHITANFTFIHIVLTIILFYRNGYFQL
jgi:hypothetical protein